LRKRRSDRALGRSARTLDEFRDGIATQPRFLLSLHLFRLRALQTNDFPTVGRRLVASLAENINHIDIYTNTLDSTRAKLLRLIDRERRKA